MKLQRTHRFATLLVLGALPLAALAADPPAPPAAKEAVPPLFGQLDANKDGHLTKDEAKRSADVTARFQELDADRDGKISATEFKTGMTMKP